MKRNAEAGLFYEVVKIAHGCLTYGPGFYIRKRLFVRSIE